MIALLINIVILTINTLYLKLRGKVTTLTSFTYNDYHYSFSEKILGKNVKLDFHCIQIRHSLSYEKWRFLDSDEYMYTVEARKYVEDDVISKSIASFPHMGFKFLHSTKHPHIRAVNAMIDCFR